MFDNLREIILLRRRTERSLYGIHSKACRRAAPTEQCALPRHECTTKVLCFVDAPVHGVSDWYAGTICDGQDVAVLS